MTGGRDKLSGRRDPLHADVAADHFGVGPDADPQRRHAR